jgi:hypothetical protein
MSFVSRLRFARSKPLGEGTTDISGLSDKLDGWLLGAHHRSTPMMPKAATEGVDRVKISTGPKVGAGANPRREMGAPNNLPGGVVIHLSSWGTLNNSRPTCRAIRWMVVRLA